MKPIAKLKKILTDEHGWILAESTIALTVYIMLVPTLLFLIYISIGYLKNVAVASHFNQVYSAATSYTKTYGLDMLAGTGFTVPTATSGPEISFSQLRTEGLLLSSVEKNGYNQSYKIYVRQPAPEVLRVIVLTEGGNNTNADFANSKIPSLASMIGGYAGFVPTGLLPSQSPDLALGSYGGWTMDFTANGVPNPGAGHLVALSDMSGKDLQSDFLYRVPIPGNPSANQMETILDMTGNGIDNVGDITWEDADITDKTCTAENDGQMYYNKDSGMFLCRNGKFEVLSDSANSIHIKEARISFHGDRIEKPICSASTDTIPRIFVTPVMSAGGAFSYPMTAIQSWAIDNGDFWTVQYRIKTSDVTVDWITPSSDYGRVMVYTMCSK